MASLESAVQRVIDGDGSAFEEIVNATSAKLVRLSARMLGSVSEAEDVVQDAYLKAYRSLVSGALDGRSSVATWLHRIVVNGAVDALRARARRPGDRPQEGAGTASDVLLEGATQGAEVAEARVALRELTDWLAELPDEQRVALVLTALEGMTGAEAAEVLGVTPGAIEQRLVRARVKLKERMGPR